MLQRALDAAAEQGVLPSSAETSSITETHTQHQIHDYGATQEDDDNDDGDDDEHYDSLYDDTSLMTGGDGSHSIEDAPPRSFVVTAYQKTSDFIWTIANVDNLWDSPIHNSDQHTTHHAPSTRNTLVVLFWFFLLALAYAVERSSFKILVDRAGPFRLFSVEVLTLSHALLLGLGMMMSALYRRKLSIKQPLGIPLDVGLMALLDTIHLLLAFITGYRVPPVLTVLCVQLMLPLTAFFTQFVHPGGLFRVACCPTSQTVEYDGLLQGEARPIRGCGGLSRPHIFGSVIIFLAVLLGLCPAFASMIMPDFFSEDDKIIPLRTAYNTILFSASSIPAAISQLYKEHVFLQHKQPVDPNALNLILSVFQFTFVMIISPLVYSLQGLGSHSNWASLYPSSGISENFKHGLECYMGTIDHDVEKYAYYTDATCEYSLALVLLHVASIMMVGVAVDKIVHAGATKVLYRGISAGIILAVIVMYIYDLSDPDFDYGPVVDNMNLVCALLLILGSEVYHRVSLQDATFETVYPEVENLYDEEDDS